MLLFCGSVLRPKGPASPCGGRIFLNLNAFGIGLVGLSVSKKTHLLVFFIDL